MTASLALAVLLALVPDARTGSITVRCDPRVELFSVVFRLAGNDEFRMASSSSPYASAVDAWFAPYAEHEAVALARRLRDERGVSWNAVPDLAVHVSDPPELAPRVPLDPLPERLDARWTADTASAFLAAARSFARASRFAEFRATQSARYLAAEERLAKTVEQAQVEGWVTTFFGSASEGASFLVIPGLLNGVASYGCGVRLPDRTLDLSPVLGVWEWDAQGLPVFGSQHVPTIAHELAHNFANPIVERRASELDAAGERLFLSAETTMRDQGYASGRIVLSESLVRASVIRYLTTHRTPAEVRTTLADDEKRGFHDVPELAALLATYEERRDEFPSLEAFDDEIVAFFVDQATQLPPLDSTRPRVVAMEPANGDVSVDPALGEIRITFSRRMRDGAWGFIGDPTGCPRVTGNGSYDEGRTVFRMPVQLEPGRRYHFWLNTKEHALFQSEEGAALEPLEVTFTTRG